jgi:predicted amidohydrolase YtcJ
VQLLDPADRHRFAAGGIAASVQPSHLGSDAAQARLLWGERAETKRLHVGVDRADGRRHAVRDGCPGRILRPVAGIALAVGARTRAGRRGRCRSRPVSRSRLERALRSACVDPPRSANETDRGRLTVGQRADLLVIPAAAIDEPVEPGGALATTRPSIVIVDGKVVFEI